MTTDGHPVGRKNSEATNAEFLDYLRSLEKRVEQLEAGKQELREELQEERKAREEAITDEQIERTSSVAIAKKEVEETIDELWEKFIEEQRTRSRADSKIEKRITIIENETGVDTTATGVVGEKLQRLVRNGPDDVTDRVYPVHNRARALLQHATDWGRVATDGNGRRVQFVAPDVKPYFEAQSGRQLSTSEIERVFQKVVDPAEDSHRRVRKDKNRDGHHRLIVWAIEDENGLTRK